MRFLLIAMLLFTIIGCSKSGSSAGVKELKADASGNFQFSAADFADGKARHFSTNIDGVKVKFFLVKADDGVVRAAFDACDVCYREKKGYQQQGNVMVCMNCGMKFRLDKINVLSGGCNPSPIAREINGDSIVISKAEIASGIGFFK